MEKSCLTKLFLLAPLAFYQCSSSDKKAGMTDLPNILIAVGDDISYPHMSAYGCKWVNTPGFDRVAREGILLMNAYTPNAKSSPSRACLLTGRNSWQLEEAANHVPFFPAKFKTFMEALGSNGYDVAYTAKGWAPGVALDISGNQRELTGKPFNSINTEPPTAGISGVDYAGNFKDFLGSRDPAKPFCFWFGSHEPHRRYEYGSGVSKGGKNVSDIERIYGFWPDNDIVRNDLLDYAYEIEHFDNHLVKMINLLEQSGELDNTIVIVTADNGMPFPRAKGQAYELSNHIPLAVMWGKGIKKTGRQVFDYLSFIDFAPTILEVAGINPSQSGMQSIEGKSFVNILKSRKKGFVDKSRDHVLVGKERHDIGRPDDIGYPIRGIVQDGFLFLMNLKPGRWPSGNPETGYPDCDASPVKSLILRMKREGESDKYWDYSFGTRVEEELYKISSDPGCIHNLAADPGLNTLRQRLRSQLIRELQLQGDPRMEGKGDIFDNYPYASETVRDFYNRFVRGEIPRSAAGWLDSTDFEAIVR